MRRRHALFIALPLSLAALDAFADGNSLNVASGETRTIDQITSLSMLTLGEGARVVASSGRNLTMTVNGVDTAMRAGTYTGNVVLTPTDDVVETFNDMGMNESYHYRSALFVDNGTLVRAKSVTAALVGGRYDDRSANGVAITSRGDNFNGVFITGDSDYTLDNLRIDFTGNGANDFTGYGAAIKTAGKARVTINNATIRTRGVVRTAVFVGGDSVVNVNRSRIDVGNGTLPADYKGGPITGGGGVMMEPPWVLGIVGNARATNVVANGEVHYNDSQVRVQGWGALSTDATRNVKLFCSNTSIEVVESGYGAYADGVSFDRFSRCRIKSPDYGAILTGGSALFTDHSTIDAGRIAVMMHSGGSGTLTIDKGSELRAREAVFQPKSSFPKIVVDGARLTSGTGVILEAVINDDPIAAQMQARMAARGMGAIDSLFSGAPGGPPRGAGTGGPPPGPNVIDASFSNVTLKGDFVNSMTTLAGMKVAFVNSRVEGGISTATAVHADGEPAREFPRRVGRMKHTFQRTEGDNGVEVTLDGKSIWTVTKTSYLTGLSLADGARVQAPKGYSLTVTVNGNPVTSPSGTLKGAIVLLVDKA